MSKEILETFLNNEDLVTGEEKLRSEIKTLSQLRQILHQAQMFYGIDSEEYDDILETLIRP